MQLKMVLPHHCWNDTDTGHGLSASRDLGGTHHSWDNVICIPDNCLHRWGFFLFRLFCLSWFFGWLGLFCLVFGVRFFGSFLGFRVFLKNDFYLK